MEQLKFSKDKVLKIDLPVLKRTQSELDWGGKMPSTRPVSHIQLMEDIMGMLEQNNQPYVQEPILISRVDATRIPALDKSKEGDINSWILRRLINVIRLSGDDMSDKDSSAGIAISYHDKGLNVAFGENVSVCSNFSIFGNKICWTEGKGGMPFSKLMDIVEKWIQGRKKYRDEDMIIFKGLKEKRATEDDVNKMLGLMLRKATNQYLYQAEDNFIPITDVTGFAHSIQKEQTEIPDKGISGWELYNMGTNILTHSTTNLVEKYKRINNFSNFLVRDYFSIN